MARIALTDGTNALAGPHINRAGWIDHTHINRLTFPTFESIQIINRTQKNRKNPCNHQASMRFSTRDGAKKYHLCRYANALITLFDEMKFAITGLILALIFVGALLLRFDRERVGPYTSDEKDDLEVKEAFFDAGRSKLYLIRSDTWAVLDLAEISQTNRAFEYTIQPKEGNFLHFKDFQSGRPSEEYLSNATSVPVLTGQYASFNYKWDGKARSGHMPPIDLPAGSKGALYRSSSEVAANNNDWFKSLLFYTDTPWQDSRHGVQFFYHPDYRTTVSFQHPTSFILLGPSFLGLTIAAFATVSGIRFWTFLLLIVVALVLHSISFSFYLFAVRYGEAWSGQGSFHNYPYIYMGCGLGVAFLLMALHLVFWRKTSNKAVDSTRYRA